MHRGGPKIKIRAQLPLLVIMLAVGCVAVGSSATEKTQAPVHTLCTVIPEEASGDLRVEVYHFHAARQCSSCIAVGSLTEKTVNTYFKDELESGKLVFAHVNYEMPENRELAVKYQITGSSLWIGTYLNGTFHREENIEVWYKINDERVFMEYLRGVIAKRIAGDLA